MLLSVCSKSIGIPLLLTVFVMAPVAAQTSGGPHRDNSGRELALVVPGMPHPAPPTPVVPVPAPVRVTAPNASSVDVPATLKTGVIIAQDLSDTYAKRARDFAKFTGMLWSMATGAPVVSPISSPPGPVQPARLPLLSSTPEP